MRSLGAPEEDWKGFLNDGKIPKIVYNYFTRTLKRGRMSKKTIQLIRDLEQEKDITIFYMIDDTVLLNNGCRLHRYIFLYVFNKSARKCKVDAMIRVRSWGIVPVYALNLHVPEFSEFGSSYFRNINGIILAH